MKVLYIFCSLSLRASGVVKHSVYASVLSLSSFDLSLTLYITNSSCTGSVHGVLYVTKRLSSPAPKIGPYLRSPCVSTSESSPYMNGEKISSLIFNSTIISLRFALNPFLQVRTMSPMSISPGRITPLLFCVVGCSSTITEYST